MSGSNEVNQSLKEAAVLGYFSNAMLMINIDEIEIDPSCAALVQKKILLTFKKLCWASLFCGDKNQEKLLLIA